MLHIRVQITSKNESLQAGPSRDDELVLGRKDDFVAENHRFQNWASSNFYLMHPALITRLTDGVNLDVWASIPIVEDMRPTGRRTIHRLRAMWRHHLGFDTLEPFGKEVLPG